MASYLADLGSNPAVSGSIFWDQFLCITHINGYIRSDKSHTYQEPKSYTAGLRQVSEATITAQSVQPQGEIPEEGRRKKDTLF